MLRGRAVVRAALAAGLAAALLSSPALAQVDGESHTPGGACTFGATASHGSAPDWDTFFECNGSSQWQRGPYFLGSTADACDSNHAGMVQWTGSGVSPNNTFEFCNGSSWITVNGAAASVALSGITAATGSQTFDSGANAQIWEWGTLSSGTALTLTTSSMQGGTLLSLQDTAAAATSTGYVLSVTDASTGKGYSIYSAMTAASNTGYAGYFTNSGTAGSYGIYVTTASAGTGYGVYASITGSGNTGYAGYFVNSDTSSAVNYSVYGSDASSSGYGGYFTNNNGGYGVYGSETGGNNTTVGVYGTNSSYTGYGVKGVSTYTGGSNSTAGVQGVSNSSIGIGVSGDVLPGSGSTGTPYAIYGNIHSSNLSLNTGYGVYGVNGPPSNGGVNWGGYFQTTTTAAGYGVEGVESGAGNTGYGGYFTNTATSGANYGVYGTDASASGYGGYFANTSTGYALYASGYAKITGSAQVGSTTASCTSGNAGMIQWTGSALQLCNGTSWLAINSSYDLSIFYPGTIAAGALVRVVADRAATYPTSLTGSYCVAKEGATASATININQIHAGSSTNVGTVVFGSGGGTNVTNCTFTAASGISLAAGDALEFAFPASPDATLGDVAITLQGTHN